MGRTRILNWSRRFDLAKSKEEGFKTFFGLPISKIKLFVFMIMQSGNSTVTIRHAQQLIDRVKSNNQPLSRNVKPPLMTTRKCISAEGTAVDGTFIDL